MFAIMLALFGMGHLINPILGTMIIVTILKANCIRVEKVESFVDYIQANPNSLVDNRMTLEAFNKAKELGIIHQEARYEQSFMVENMLYPPHLYPSELSRADWNMHLWSVIKPHFELVMTFGDISHSFFI